MPLFGQRQEKFEFVDQLRKAFPDRGQPATPLQLSRQHHGRHAEWLHSMSFMHQSGSSIVQFAASINALSLSHHETALLMS
jgi:hypothetical protein